MRSMQGFFLKQHFLLIENFFGGVYFDSQLRYETKIWQSSKAPSIKKGLNNKPNSVTKLNQIRCFKSNRTIEFFKSSVAR